MAGRLGVCVATLLLFFGAAVGKGAEPSAAPPANDDCLACHGDADAKRESGTSVAVDAGVFSESKHGSLACVDCHQDLASVAEFPHPDKLARVNCATCHDEEGAKYRDSIHSWAKEKAGLTNTAPSCADCHGSHDVRGPDDEKARVFKANVPATCGSCHEGVLARFDTSAHATARKAGNAAAPVCSDCHTAHTISRADTDKFRLDVAAECGTCHSDVVESFRRTFHGKVTELGFVRVAECADCHGAHDILPASNPASMVAKVNLVRTCSKCHQGANESFVKFDPHPNPHSYSRSPVMWWVNQFYTILIAGCFGFFGLHSALWFRRSWHERGGER